VETGGFWPEMGVAGSFVTEAPDWGVEVGKAACFWGKTVGSGVFVTEALGWVVLTGKTGVYGV